MKTPIKKSGLVGKKTATTPRAIKAMEIERKLDAAKASEARMLNLRCPKEGCNYFAKTTEKMLQEARLKCPKCRSILQTKDERGETRGRHFAESVAA